MHIINVLLGRCQYYFFIYIFAFLYLIFNPAQAGMIDKEGMAPWDICGLCHSLNGISATAKFPKLAGQKTAYIKKQFIEFNQEQRTNDGGQMVAITTEVDATTIDDIADYFSSLAPPPPMSIGESSEQIDLYKTGKELFTKGRASIKGPANTSSGEGLPACITCHGVASTQAPWLYAQHGPYVVKQLKDFKSGERDNDGKGVMRAIASALSDEDMVAIAAYLTSTQPRL